MAAYVRGDVVLSPFPGSGEEKYKDRPAIVLQSWFNQFGEVAMLCMITTKDFSDPYTMPIYDSDLVGVTLTANQSFVSPTYVYSVPVTSIKKIGTVTDDMLDRIMQALRNALA